VLALAPLQTAWFRVELVAVGISPDEVKELRELDIVLLESEPAHEKGELVLSTGARFAVTLSSEGDRWVATVGERVVRLEQADQLAINRVFRVCDPRELPTVGTTITLVATGEPLALSWRNELIGHGHLVEVEGERGVRVSSRLRG
jgi:hypothetical protein